MQVEVRHTIWKQNTGGGGGGVSRTGSRVIDIRIRNTKAIKALPVKYKLPFSDLDIQSLIIKKLNKKCI